MTERFDVVVLGGGPGGYVAAFRKPSTDWPDT
jgi:pyruvate/2-oxoglutarate dehydrogenase complex dihydrolipoamide dehydrogenase (E3) component